METGQIIYEKVYESPRPPPKICLSKNWMEELGSEVPRQAESSQPTQPNPNPIHRTWRPVDTGQTSRSSAQEVDTRFSLDCENTNLSVELLDKDKDTDEDVDADRVRTETSPKFSCSRTSENDRESHSSTRSSSRSATK